VAAEGTDARRVDQGRGDINKRRKMAGQPISTPRFEWPGCRGCSPRTSRTCFRMLKEAQITKGELNQYCVEAFGSVAEYNIRHDASNLIDWLRKR
jgi:hypothetical protein